MGLKIKKQISYLLKITDRTGIIEHCIFDKANYKEGYCVDDNARALQVCLRLRNNHPKLNKVLVIYFTFLKSAFNDNKFYNDIDLKLSWKKIKTNKGEHFGRALAALGELINNKEKKSDEAIILFDKIYNLFKKNKSFFLRPVAQIICGLKFYRKEEIEFWADLIIDKYLKEKNDNWRWFEPILSYDIGRIPLSLLVAYQVTNNKKYLDIAIESLDFLTEVTFSKKHDCFVFPGNKGWFTKSGKRKIFDQQPLEAGSLVEAYSLAFIITRNNKYKELALKAFSWYKKKNIIKADMINPKNGGVYDGFSNKKINKNQGAESILAYIIAYNSLAEIQTLDK